MKPHFLLVAIISIAFAFSGCTMKDSINYKATIVPESKSSVITLNDMNSAAEIISKRLNNSLGIQNESVKLDVTDKQISLTISKTDTSKIPSVKKLITGYARLEFWETYENSEIMGYLTKANNLLSEMKVVPEVKNSGTLDASISKNPLLGVLKPMVTENGEPLRSCLIGVASETDTAKVDGYLQMPQVKDLFPRDIKFLWSHSPVKDGPSKGLYGLHAIKVTTQDGRAPLDGSVISSAKTVTGKSGSDIKIDLTMTAEGSSRWAKITRDNINHCIAVVLNGNVRSYPRVQAEITGRNTEITGNFKYEEANDLVNMFKSGELPLALKIIDEQVIKIR